jgi:MFS family permease
MEYLLAILVFIGIWSLTTLLSGIFGLLIPILYLFLGFVFGIESFIIGVAALLGSVLNVYIINKYIRESGALSSAPNYGKIASIGYIIVFTITTITKHIFEYEISNINYWNFLFIAFILWIVISFTSKKRRLQTMDNLKESVIGYKIIKKYDTEPMWAIYLYFNNGGEGWNETIPGSFCAKDPENDLTFVFDTKKRALEYAQDFFSNAKHIDE